MIGAGGREQRQTQAEKFAGERGLQRVLGEEARKSLRTGGSETRLTRQTEGEQARALERTRGSESRRTDLQRESFRRYKENRDYSQARGSARV